MAKPKLEVRKVAHANFHLGVQLDNLVYSSLNAVKHAKHNLEMWAMPNGTLHVCLNDQEWIIPNSVIHSMKLDLSDKE